MATLMALEHFQAQAKSNPLPIYYSLNNVQINTQYSHTFLALISIGRSFWKVLTPQVICEGINLMEFNVSPIYPLIGDAWHIQQGSNCFYLYCIPRWEMRNISTRVPIAFTYILSVLGNVLKEKSSEQYSNFGQVFFLKYFIC